jgi:hypothetical protein
MKEYSDNDKDFVPGAMIEFKDDADRCGYIKYDSDDGNDVYVQMFVKNPGGCTYLGVNRELLIVARCMGG